MATTPLPMLNKDVNMIQRMEEDLTEKAKVAFTTYQLKQNIFGVFSLDDLEGKLESDFCNNIGVGIGFMQVVPTGLTTDPKAPLNVGSQNAVKQLDYFFGVILAVPTGEQCKERNNATKVLTALRFSIMGSVVAGDASSRTWAFVKEAPEIAQSSDTMLYYQQVWRVAIPTLGNR